MPAADEPIEIASEQWDGRRVVAVTLDRPEAVDLTLDNCDLAGVTSTGGSFRRVTVRRTRLRDCTFGGGIVQDVAVEACTGERLSARFSTLQRVVVEDSRLPGFDLYGATLDKVVFRDCDLTGAAFDGVTVKELRLERCTLTGITGVTSLRGAEVDFDDLMTLAPSMAKELGLKVR